MNFRKIISYPIFLFHMSIMMLLLIIFHIIQVITYNIFGYNAHKKSVDMLNFFMTYNLFTVFCRPIFKGFDNLPTNRPLIVVSNHQSMYDISPVVWGFRKHHVKFIAKAELGRDRMPSIAYNLKKGGSVLIDRRNGSKSIKEILKLGRKMEEKNWSACLFPEGSRSKDGKLRKFQPAGFKTLLKASPSAIIVPFVIDGNYRIGKWENFPRNIGRKIYYTALTPIERDNFTDEELLEKVKSAIQHKLDGNK